MINIVDLPARPAEIERDGYDRPKVVPPGGTKAVAYTRVTTFADCLDDKSALATWGKRMVLVGLGFNPQMLEQARGLDPDDATDKRKLNAIAEQAFEASGANDKRERGTYLHKLSELVDARIPIGQAAVSKSDIMDMAAYHYATQDLRVVHAERLVVLDSLKVAGTPDRISHYSGPGPDGKPIDGNLITDLKTGTVEYGVLKMAMQLALYSRGEHYDHVTQTRTALPDVNQEWGLIFNLRPGSGECEVYWINLDIGWTAVQVAVEVRKMRAINRKKILVPRALTSAA